MIVLLVTVTAAGHSKPEKKPAGNNTCSVTYTKGEDTADEGDAAKNVATGEIIPLL